MASEYITKEGLKRIGKRMAEIERERPEVIKLVAEAREQGDLSENAEYHAARERLKNIENEYNHLNRRVGILQVLDTDQIPKDAVRFGAVVLLKEISSNEQKKYKIVGIDETFDYNDGVQRVSTASPLGRAVLGKKKNDKCVAKAPIGDKIYQILEIS